MSEWGNEGGAGSETLTRPTPILQGRQQSPHHSSITVSFPEKPLTFTLFFLPAQSNFRCPERDGYFPDPVQCDKYYDCLDDIPEDRLCPDGLVFDPFSRKREPCDHYFNVDCGDRLELRKSISRQSLMRNLSTKLF